MQRLLNKGYFLEFSYLRIDNVSDEELRSLEGDLIEEFRKRFGSVPIWNKQVPSRLERSTLPEKHFKIIEKYTY